MKNNKSKIRSLSLDPKTNDIDFDEFMSFWRNDEFKKYVLGNIFDKIVIVFFKKLMPNLPSELKKKFVFKKDNPNATKELLRDPAFKDLKQNIPSFVDTIFPGMLPNQEFVVLVERFLNRTMIDKKISKQEWIDDCIGIGSPPTFSNIYQYAIRNNFITDEYIKPVLNSIPSRDAETLKYNLEFIKNNTNFNIDPKSVSKQNWLRKYKIKELIGHGAFGFVFSFENENFVIKIYSSFGNGKKELRRYAKMAKRAFTGASTLSELHIYDYGKLKDDNGEISFAIMPRLIPDEAKYRNSLNKDLILVIKHVSSRLIIFDPNKRFRINLKHFLDMLEHYLKTRQFNSLEMSYITAAYRAVKYYGGKDLHPGNIGHFAGHEDKPFFFDM